MPLESSSSPQKDVNSPVAEIAIRNVFIFSDNSNCDEAIFLLLIYKYVFKEKLFQIDQFIVGFLFAIFGMGIFIYVIQIGITPL